MTQARERAERARAWTEDFSLRVATASDRLARAEAAWREAEGAGLNVEGPKYTSPWGLIPWAISTGLLLVLNEKRKGGGRDLTEAAMRVPCSSRLTRRTWSVAPSARNPR